MKKLISIFLILCMMATLLPTVAFATEGDATTVDPIVADFSKIGFDGNTSGKLSAASADGFEIVSDKSTGHTAYVNNICKNGLRVSPCTSSNIGNGITWYTTTNKEDPYLMFTININASKEGYYTPTVEFWKHDFSGDFAVYVNDQYAGEIAAHDAGITKMELVAADITDETLNVIHLNQGNNEISFKVIQHYKRVDAEKIDQTWLFLRRFTLTPCEEAFVPVTFSYDFPEKVVADKPAEFTASVAINEALTRFSGKYNEDGSNMADLFTFFSNNGTVEIAEMTDDTVKGTFTAAAGGPTTITATANVNGKAYTETIETTAVAPIVATFSQNKNVTGATRYEYAALDTDGYEIDTVNSRTGTIVMNHDGYIMSEFYVANNSTTGHPWPTRNENGFIFTINVEAAEAGYYASEFKHKAANNGAGFTMYVNEVAQGEIDGFIPGKDKITGELTTNLNTVYLNAGQNEISFRLTKTYKRHTDAEGTTEAATFNGMWFYPRKLTFTPVDAAPTPVGFTTTLSEAKAGKPVEFTVKPVMSDGSDMYFGIYDDAGTKITDKPITLTASSGKITNLTRTTEGVSGTFTATEAGTATITASTTINGEEYTDTFNVTVTSDEDEAVTLPTTITMSVTGSDGKVTVDGVAQESSTATYSKNVGASVTVVAEEISGKIFRGWLRGGEDGTVVWLEPEYTFTAATNVALFAKYTDAPAESAEVSEYYDWNGEFLAYTKPETSTLSKYGFSFKEWLDTVVNDITRYVADYDTTNTYKITIPSGVNATVDDNATADLTAVAHDAKVTLTNASDVSWYVNGKTVAYGTSYTFYATEDADITIDNEVQEGPIVNLTKPEGDTYILEYNANDATVIEKGIIFGGDGASVTSCSYKVISQRNATFGKLMAENDEDSTVVRGYIIYNDNGTYRVAYADIAE